MRNLFSHSLRICLFAFVFLVSTRTFAQTDLTNCYGSCTSGDFTIVRAFLSNASGTPIAQSACNDPSATVTAYISFVFENTTNSARNGIFISGTIGGATVSPAGNPAGYIFRCFSGVLPKKSQTTFTDLTHTISWQCGTTLTLSNTFISWGAAGEDVCTNTCAQATPSKCRTVGGVTIETPLSANFSFSGSCTAGNQFQTIAFDGSHSGGGSGTATFDWDFGDGTTHGTTEDLSHTYTSGGSKTVTLSVTLAGVTKTVSKTVTVGSCCTAPTVSDQPDDATKCAGESVTFTVASTGGNPTPTVQWQEKVGAGSFTDLANGGVYSGVTTLTLTISNVTGKNGNQYRAVFTSGVCTAVNTDAATLTVNARPQQPAVEYVPPACDQVTFSLIIGNTTTNPVIEGATYTLRDKNGAIIAGVSPTNPHVATAAEATAKQFTFSGIPAGSGYSVSIVSSGCAPTGSASVCGTPDAAKTQRVIVSNELNTVAQPTVKAYPNPFNDRVKFVVNSAVAGNGSLEIYNMTGQKIKTVYQGRINAGDQSFELSLPVKQQTPLIYMLRVGSKQVTGKLLQLNK